VADNEPATPDDLNQLERRVDARFQAVNARFAGIDGRFATLGDQLGRIDHELQSLERRSDVRCASVDRRIDATRAQVEHVRSLITAQLDETHRGLRRIVLLGLLGTFVCTAAMCLLTIVLTV
jgi:chromosome segregation ATPase